MRITAVEVSSMKVTEDNVLTQAAVLEVYQPRIAYNGKGIRWFDDSSLCKSK